MYVYSVTDVEYFKASGLCYNTPGQTMTSSGVRVTRTFDKYRNNYGRRSFATVELLLNDNMKVVKGKINALYVYNDTKYLREQKHQIVDSRIFGISREHGIAFAPRFP